MSLAGKRSAGQQQRCHRHRQPGLLAHHPHEYQQVSVLHNKLERVGQRELVPGEAKEVDAYICAKFREKAAFRHSVFAFRSSSEKLLEGFCPPADTQARTAYAVGAFFRPRLNLKN